MVKIRLLATYSDRILGAVIGRTASSPTSKLPSTTKKEKRLLLG
jgi:hypothetical protein